MALMPGGRGSVRKEPRKKPKKGGAPKPAEAPMEWGACGRCGSGQQKPVVTVRVDGKAEKLCAFHADAVR